MGQGKLHGLMVLAGIFTLGMAFGHSERADASVIVLSDVVITPSDRECTGGDEDDADCWGDAETRSECVYLPDGQGFYMVTCF